MSRTHVCVIGYGTAGRLHERLLAGLGFTVSVVDPSPAAAPAAAPVFRHPEEVPRHLPVDVWSVCSPTAAHLAAVEAVLAVDPAARLLVEKPVCRSWEIPALVALLARHERARLVVMDQYRHAQAVALLRTIRKELAPGHPLRAVRVGFGKDRRADIAAGRFVDRDYGVFGYEWLHMLALVRGVLPADAYDAYLRAEPGDGGLRVALDPELTSTAAHETGTAGGAAVELYSTVVGPDPSGQVPVPSWFDRPRAHRESRQRRLEVTAGPVVLGLDLDPVTLPNGTRLPRNTHRLAVEGPGLRREWLVHDSPMENALRRSMAALLTEPGPPGLDLRAVSRIGRLAASAKAASPASPPPTAPSARL
ncbi:hypothetical protein GCM10027168_30670 [Streptomyces capparidis]